MSNVDQANKGSLAGTMQQAFRHYMMQVDGMLPCEVVSYQAPDRVTVRPLIKMLTTDGLHVERNTIPNIPVFRLGGGGFVIRFPIKQGDKGWIIASDRDISLMMQRKWRSDIPNTERIKSFSDGLFLPDPQEWSASDESALTIQSDDGSTTIEVSNGSIKLKASSIELESSTLTHNGVNIGSDHTHTDVQPGNGKTGKPE